MRPLAYITIPALWFLFVVAQIAAPVVAVFVTLTGNTRYISRVVKAQDKATAAFLGFSGDKTVSRECAERESTCRLCAVLCRALHYTLEKNHCPKEIE